MSEYWKSTPKYWCKHCSVYVRDTKLERTNHESTGRHQGNLKRFLRELHRGHENEEREKDRAKREVERLNGVVGSSSSAGAGGSSAPSISSGLGAGSPIVGGWSSRSGTLGMKPSTGATAVQRQQQWEQLADMGIDVPTELRRDMAMAGEWTVTNTRIVDDAPKPDPETNPQAIATGVRKRPKQEGEEEEEELQNLFKKQKTGTWGRDDRAAPLDDKELDALLSIPLAQPKTELVKKEKIEVKTEPVKKEKIEVRSNDTVKMEPAEDEKGIEGAARSELGTVEAPVIKTEENTESGVEVPVVVFKKRKPKNIRQK